MHDQNGETGLVTQAKDQWTTAIVEADAKKVGHIDQLSVIGRGRKVEGKQGCQVSWGISVNIVIMYNLFV